MIGFYKSGKQDNKKYKYYYFYFFGYLVPFICVKEKTIKYKELLRTKKVLRILNKD